MKYYLGPWVQEFVPWERWRAPDGAVGVLDFRSLPGHNGPTNGFFAVRDDVTLGADYRFFGQGHITEVVPPESDRGVFASMLGMPGVSGSTLMDWVWDALTVRADPMGSLRAKPLIPTLQRELEMHLGGHSLVRRKAFDLTMPEAANVIAVLQEDYRGIRSAALDGKLGRSVQGKFVPDPEFHRMVLDVWGEKFGVDRPEEVFIPAGVPREQRKKHATTITESFNKADADTLGPDLTWTELRGDIDVVSNQARSTTLGSTCTARADSALSSSDTYAQAIVDASEEVSSAYVGTIVRKDSSATLNYYHVIEGFTEDTIYVASVTAGVSTTIATAAQVATVGTPKLIKLQANGSTIKSFWDGVEKTSSTDTTFASGLYCGLVSYKDITGYLSWDSFEAADLAATRFDSLCLLGVS